MLVRDDDEADAAVGRRMTEELLQRLEPAGRSADADDGKPEGLRRLAVFDVIHRRGGLGLLDDVGIIFRLPAGLLLHYPAVRSC